MEVCPHCGERTDTPDNISMWGMYDNHTFTRYYAKTPEELIDEWRKSLREDDPAISLCPVVVKVGKKELRRVGEMLHPDYVKGVPRDEEAIRAFCAALYADPDISRLMSQSS